MEASRICDLLASFLGSVRLTSSQIEQISIYLDLLLRWNAKTNLTAIRDPEEMVRRHFGESLFAATHLYSGEPSGQERLIDFGSGAGFPGIPIKIYASELHVTLIESQNKKATFLREVIRALGLKDIQVHAGRAEGSGLVAKTVTMRAVEKFEQSLPMAVSLLDQNGRLALLIGAGQVEKARSLVPSLQWSELVRIPGSAERVLFVGEKR